MYKCNNSKLVSQIFNVLLINNLIILRKELLKSIILLFSKKLHRKFPKTTQRKNIEFFFF